MGREGGRRGVPLAAGVVAVAVAALVVGGCGTEREADRLQPLGTGRSDRDPTTSTVLVPGTVAPAPTPAPAAPPPATGAAADPVGAGGPDGAASAVGAVLDRYDRALTDLVRRPDAASDPTSPARAALDAVVPTGSALSDDVVAAAVGRARDGVVVHPGPEGLAYRHRVLVVERAEDATIGFTWCGWSPGVARRVATGAVVDDGVAHTHGSGRVRSTPLGDVLDSLDQSDLAVLPAGAPDPCPAEVARAATGNGAVR